MIALFALLVRLQSRLALLRKHMKTTWMVFQEAYTCLGDHRHPRSFGHTASEQTQNHPSLLSCCC